MRRALLAAVIAALCLPAGAAARVPRDFFGVMANGPLDAPGFALDAESAAMRSAGVQTERMEISWDLVEPQKGQYDYALTDRKVLAAARAGLDVLALIVRSPGWAARHPGNPFSAPRDPADYAAFATTLVARYGPGGELWREHPEVARAAGPRLAGVERAQPRRLLGRAAVHAWLCAAAQRGRRRDQARRPRRHGRDGGPGQLLLARPRAALRQGRGEAALRRGGGASVQRAAVERREDRRPEPQGPRPPRRQAASRSGSPS